MVAIPVEIIVCEILSRVPTKVVGRSKSVCKEWYALLSTPDFAKIHCSRSLKSTNQRVLFVGDQTCYVRPINNQSCEYGLGTIVHFPFNDFSIHSHLDGLLCVRLESTTELLLWNPITGAYKNLSTNDFHGFFLSNQDAVGLYIDLFEDYKVLHIKRRCGVYFAKVYSRRLDSWRSIPFITRPEYIRPSFNWSSGTLCGDTLYFTISESYVGGVNVVICFDVNLEQFKEISFPPVPSKGIYKGELLNVNNELYMFVSTGYRQMSVELWKLEGEHWSKVLSSSQIPNISLDLWCSMTHFMTNGNWLLMNREGKLCEIEMDTKPFECFYHASCFRLKSGAIFLETVVSPTL
ncbi:hypothetical protein SSX86_008040 [Deinandra increscens subsp. villosa]|uniref:F-box domain-containing protein n=1 Tax=Deinandra increscens subsp. villosa TaxID=3103831 RepID=A0AAP0H452_9ASTR